MHIMSLYTLHPEEFLASTSMSSVWISWIAFAFWRLQHLCLSLLALDSAVPQLILYFSVRNSQISISTILQFAYFTPFYCSFFCRSFKRSFGCFLGVSSWCSRFQLQSYHIEDLFFRLYVSLRTPSSLPLLALVYDFDWLLFPWLYFDDGELLDGWKERRDLVKCFMLTAFFCFLSLFLNVYSFKYSD